MLDSHQSIYAKLAKAQSIIAFDMASELVTRINGHCDQLGFEIVAASDSSASGIAESIDSCALMLINVDGLLDRIRKHPPELIRKFKDRPSIGVYGYHPRSIFSLCEVLDIRYLVPASEPEHIVFAICRESEKLGLKTRATNVWEPDRGISGDYLKPAKLSLPTSDRIASWYGTFFDRQAFTQYLEEYLVSLSRKENGALAIIEIDHFQSIKSDTSDTGYLADVMRLIKGRSRQSDLIGRFSKTTFALFSTRFTDKTFSVFAEHLRLSISENLYEDDGDYLKLKCGIGICFWNAHIADIVELIARAEQACAKASIGDGNQVQIYQTVNTSLDMVEDEEDTAKQIASALKENRFRLIFQPIVRLATGGEENYAVLLRMLDTEGRHLTPDRFLPVAENNGLIRFVDQWVLGRCVELVRRADQEGKKRKFFIKISGYSLVGDRFIKCLYYFLQKAKLDGNQLVIQIDYAEYINNRQRVTSFMKAIKKAKCRVAFDHFGFGKYSIEELKNLPLDYIKIDGTFTHHLDNKAAYRQTVKSIQKAANRCGIRTIAKSVEDANTLAQLWNIGVDAVQGYFIQEPEEDMHYSFIF